MTGLVRTPTSRRFDLRRRRGVTLIEMIVVIGLLVLMMSIVVQIFQSATSAVSIAQVNQSLDQNLRRLDQAIRTDLAGITAKMTPPLNPQDNLGYFEYGENQFSDPQGEDTDDYMAFTVKAPAGQPFTGRMWVHNPALPPAPDASPLLADRDLSAAGQQLTMPITVTSEFAEVIYFLRNGNLYRRVLLILPRLKGSRAFSNRGLGSPHNVGWTGAPANESAFRSATMGMFVPGVSPPLPVAMSWQGVNDISSRPGSGIGVDTTNNVTELNEVPTPNTLGDLTNRQNRFARPRHTSDYFTPPDPNNPFLRRFPDGLDDDVNADGIADLYMTLYPNVFAKPAHDVYGNVVNGALLAAVPNPGVSVDALSFPYIFPGMYSRDDGMTNRAGNHLEGSLHGMPVMSLINGAGASRNHAPLELGDSLTVPPSKVPADNQLETWFGFPTWRETISSSWLDPMWQLNGYDWIKNGQRNQFAGLSWDWARNRALPPLGLSSPNPSPFSDQAGYRYMGQRPPREDEDDDFYMPVSVWQDDLIMTGVRSFDVKAYDPNVKYFDDGTAAAFQYGASHMDLGYGHDLIWPPTNANLALRSNSLNTFGHEGRIPPLVSDFRNDPNWPQNVGDDDPAIIRLRRVYDTWSTDYSKAPALPFNAPPFNVRPALPSYPAPYAVPLTGVQIQIRVVDPRNERVRILTIRQDFSDKL